MCGLVVVANNSKYALNTEDFFKDAMLASQVRGIDSSGVFILDNEGEARIRKSGLNASTFLGNRTTEEFIDKVCRSKVAIGHVRAATVGNISMDNAHPFQATRDDGTFIIGAHNGTLQGWKNKEDGSKFEVDSQWLFHMLAKKGPEAFKYFNGAFAIVWYDSAKPDSLFMARNDQRPLHFMITASGNTILTCSELGMLGWLADKHKFKTHSDYPDMYYLESGKTYEFNLKNIGEWTTTDYAKYDHTTSSTTVNLTSRHSVMYPAMYGMDDDWDYHGYSGQTYSYESEQEEVLRDLKKALRDARYSKVVEEREAKQDDEEDARTVDLDDLDAAMQKVLADISSKDTPPWTTGNAVDRGEVCLLTVTGKSATTMEIKNSKDLGAYGMVVRFEGVWYDDDTAECWGEYKLHAGTANEECYEAVIRNISRKYAEDVFMDRLPDSLEYAAVVGVDKDVTFFVVEHLNRDQRNYVEDYLSDPSTRTLVMGGH